MTKERILMIISLFLSSISFALAISLWGGVNGFEHTSDWEMDRAHEAGIYFSGTPGPSFYDVMGNAYLIIAVCFYVYMVGKFIKLQALTHTISFATLGLVLYKFFQLFQYKYEVLEISGSATPHSYHDWLLKSLSIDWFCVFAVVFLLIIQIITLFLNNFVKRYVDE